jgi:beta-N-acetylhexosaminidase
MKWRNVLIILLTLLASFLAYNYFQQPFLKYFPEPVVEEFDKESVEEVELSSIKDLSTREKISQMLALPLLLDNKMGIEDKETLKLLKEYQPGFIVYFGEEVSFNTAKAYQDSLLEIFEEDGVLPLIAVDHEGGLVQRLSGEGFTTLPSMRQLTASIGISEDNQNSNLLNARERNSLLNQSAKELSEVGINLVLAPVVDYSPNAHPILTSRIGDDPDKIVQIAKEYIQAFSNWQIMPVLKHFPGIGSSQKDLHITPDTVDLDKNDTLIFEKLLDQYPNLGVMSAHLRLRDKLAGQPCSLSKQCLDQLFQFYPETLVISDDLLMDSASYLPGTSETRSLSEIAISAIEAGNHVLLFGLGFDYEQLPSLLNNLEKKYEDSLDFQNQVDRASNKVLSLKRINK